MKKKVELELVGLNGNAYSIMGAFKHAARQQGWTPEEIKVVLDEASSGDYDHLLATILEHTTLPGDGEADEQQIEENEQQRRDEKHGLYGGREDDAN